ncbi:DEKNAAC100720 [Brettanomyces naardenensis]|uniref:DEKNAAC100720 n=1 Tax=Brettanomyces naardenensis TaxID=13370 RepID=A0A448YFD4_BRENA|nr:DEKNAAC100720 [Brettanomyces naardenensis]
MLDPSKVIEFLSKYASCDVSDALVKRGHKFGGYIPNLNRYSSNAKGTTMAGKAYTILFAPKDDPRPAIKGGYIDNLPADSVLVISTTTNLQKLDSPFTKLNNALYGGLMSTRAQYLKSNGTVVFGRIRDIDEHRDLHRDVFAYGIGSTAHAPVVKMVGINVPLEILIDEYPEPRKEIINPGDYIVGDNNGIVKVEDNAELETLIDYIPKRVNADNLVKEDILKGEKCNPSQKKRRAGL